MKVEVKVLLRNQVKLPESAVCRVEIRDVSLMDVPSVTINSYETPIKKTLDINLLTVVLEVSDKEIIDRHLNVWSHLSLSGSKQVQKGDFITMQAYPITTGASSVSVIVELQPVN